MEQPTPLRGKPDLGCPYYPTDWTNAPALSTITARLVSSHNFGFLKTLDPARILRQEEAEIVFRNRAFVKYSFEQNLYSKEGLGARFIAASNWTQANAPFRNRDLAISYPSDAVMFKADFISEKLMRESGLIRDIPGSNIPNNPENPYITLFIDADVGRSPDFKPGRYYLLAITAASKALPAWHWYAIEHVGNPGRCDFNGCNDSFGFTALGRSPSGKELRQNYIPPHTQVAFTSTSRPPGGGPLQVSDEVIFDPGKTYLPKETGEQMTPELERLFREMGIGNGKSTPSGNRPTHEDPAWKSYRLKGTQVEFVTTEGMEINVGASITEGGFVNSASCMTCHSQAGPNATGNPGLAGVGSQPRLNDFGYNQTVYGPPDLGWFYSYGTPNLIALQSDFAWGMLNANCVNPQLLKGQPTGNCANYQVAAPRAVVENLGPLAGSADALWCDAKTTSIANQQDADKRCPSVCTKAGYGQWNGQWTNTPSAGGSPVCGCGAKMKTADVKTSIIANQQDAAQRCPTVCTNAKAIWNGQWTNTPSPGCGCLTPSCD
jgi:hypothetical protein